MSSNTGKGVNSKLDDCLGYILQSSRGYDMRLEVNSPPLMSLTGFSWALAYPHEIWTDPTSTHRTSLVTLVTVIHCTSI